MNTKEFVEDSLIGREFFYRTKYGGIVVGEVGEVKTSLINTSEEFEVRVIGPENRPDIQQEFKIPIGRIYSKFVIKIVSTNGVEYNYEDLYFYNSKGDNFL